jgi:hypothetical protein
VAALFLMNYALARAGYAGNHFAAAVPIYAALLFLAVRYALSDRAGIVSSSLAVGVLLALLPYSTEQDHWNLLATNVGHAKQAHREEVSRLDDLMDRCSIERYFALEDPLSFTFASHSPWGPIFNFSVDLRLTPDHPLVQETNQNVVHRNELYLASKSGLPSSVEAFVREYFTTVPPNCAESSLPIGNWEAWFRKGAAEESAGE